MKEKKRFCELQVGTISLAKGDETAQLEREESSVCPITVKGAIQFLWSLSHWESGANTLKDGQEQITRGGAGAGGREQQEQVLRRIHSCLLDMLSLRGQNNVDFNFK